MNIAIRDEILLEAYPNIKEGLQRLNLNQVELFLSQEFTIYHPLTTDKIMIQNESALLKVKELLESSQITVAGLLTDFDMSVHSLDASVQWFTETAHIAHKLNAKVIRVDSLLSQEHLYTFSEKVALFNNVFTEVLSRTSELPVSFGIENHGKEGNDPIFLLSVINEINHPRFGITLDFANFYWRGFPLSEVMAILKLFVPYTKHTHVKNIAYPESVREIFREVGWEYEVYVCPVNEGDIDIETILIELKKQKYGGALCIEDESLHHCSSQEQKRNVLQQDVEFLIETANDIQFDN